MSRPIHSSSKRGSQVAGYIYTLAGGGLGLAVDRYGSVLRADIVAVFVLADRTGRPSPE